MSDDHDGDSPGDARPDGGGTTPPSLDTVFDLLSDRRRRYALYHLVEAGPTTVEYTSLAERVADWEADGDEASADRVETVAADLYHSHLPKLDAENVVDFDPRSGVVRYRGQPTVEEYAEHAAHQELPEG
ncbi:DUF7344 domain-containing protein [Halostella litorea]|uniref:DUF7344 domain-containing protein n=1 Tax=Halostella litorea TaxID=2528831 RepID=UPI00192A4936|nr:hypothetical protein [Halostella litorea]